MHLGVRGGGIGENFCRLLLGLYFSLRFIVGDSLLHTLFRHFHFPFVSYLYSEIRVSSLEGPFLFFFRRFFSFFIFIFIFNNTFLVTFLWVSGLGNPTLFSSSLMTFFFLFLTFTDGHFTLRSR